MIVDFLGQHATTEGQNRFAMNRLFQVMVVMIIVFVFIVGFIFNDNYQLRKSLSFANANRIMIGIQGDDGFYRSIKTIPKQVLLDTTKDFTSNFYNWDSYSIDENMKLAQTKMTPKLRKKLSKKINSNAIQAKNQGITSIFHAHGNATIERTDKGFIVAIPGHYKRLQGGDEFFIGKLTSTVTFERRPPTAKYPLGIRITDVTEDIRKRR